MIYITFKHNSFSGGTYINNVWESQYVYLERAYKSFLEEKAKELNITINPHWRNIMNYEDYHTHLSEIEYKVKSKEWSKFLRMWNFDKFIAEKGKGFKVKYIEVKR